VKWFFQYGPGSLAQNTVNVTRVRHPRYPALPFARWRRALVENLRCRSSSLLVA
jgi:hypothetical protein